MTAAGWAIMIVSITAVTSACAYCVSRVLTSPPNNDFHAPGRSAKVDIEAS